MTKAWYKGEATRQISCLLASWSVILTSVTRIQARIKSLTGMEIKITDFRIISGAAKTLDMIASDIAPGVKARI